MGWLSRLFLQKGPSSLESVWRNPAATLFLTVSTAGRSVTINKPGLWTANRAAFGSGEPILVSALCLQLAAD